MKNCGLNGTIRLISKNGAIKLLQNVDSTEKRGTL